MRVAAGILIGLGVALIILALLGTLLNAFDKHYERGRR